MARTGRRDCRRRDPKKNHINKRVEELQKAIKKAKKEGVAAPEYRKDGLPTSERKLAAQSEPAELTTTASEFLLQLRSEAAESVSQLRDGVATHTAMTNHN